MMDQLRRIYAILYRIRTIVAKYRALMNEEQARDLAEVDQLMTELHGHIHGGSNERKD